MFEPGDFTLQFLAFRRIAFEQFAEGHLPVFTECIYSGYPFQQDPQAQVLYPPVLAFMLMGRGLGWGTYPLQALQWEVMLHTLLAAIGMFAFLRELKLSRIPSVAGALTFAFGGYLTSYPILQTAILETAAWLPLLMLFLHRVVMDSRWVRPALAAALVGAISFTAGHPQTLMIMVYACALAFGWWAKETALPAAKAIPRAVFVMLFLVAFSAAQLIPSLSFMLGSTRAGLNYETAGGGFGLHDIAQFLIPRALANWSALYVGVVGLTLAFLALRAVKAPGALKQATGALTKPFIWMALGALVISFGINAFGFDMAYLAAPGYRQFQSQARHALVIAFALAALAALGLQTLMTSSRRPRVFSRALVVAAIGLALIPAVLYFGAKPIGNLSPDAPPIIARLFVQAALFLALAWVLARPRPLGWALLALMALDLLIAQQTASTVPFRDPFPPNSLLTAIPKTDERINNHFGLPLNYGCLNGLNEIGGGSPIVLATYKEFLARTPEEVLAKLLNVRYAVTWRGGMGTDSGAVIPSHKIGEGKLYDTPVNTFALDWEPRPGFAWVASKVTAVSLPNEIYARMADKSFDPFGEVIVEQKDLTGFQNLLGLSKNVGVEGKSAGYIKIAASLDAPGILVVSEAWHWNWIAQVDGAEVKPILADGALIGVPLGAGHHTIELSYRPLDLWVGAGVSVLAILAGLILLARKPKSLRDF